MGAARGRDIRFESQAGLWREVADRVTSQTLTPATHDFVAGTPSPFEYKGRGEPEHARLGGTTNLFSSGGSARPGDLI
jgi:hypothetical protein